ncbi:MAG: circularly permuted type 2 ATP-grasp protein [Ilumatobacteraceae bacterium]
MRSAGELLDRFLDDRLALQRRQQEADRVIAASLAGHLVHDLRTSVGRDVSPNRPWRLDPVPVVIEHGVFAFLADMVRQRLLAMEVLLADLYGPRVAVREGWVPAEALSSSDHYRLAAIGAPPPPRWLTSYAVDVIALADGSWRVVQDQSDTPTGIGYALLDRSVMARVAAELLGPEAASDLASISGFPAELRHALTTLTAASSPRVVLFSGGVEDAAYVEHSSLARVLGFNLVEGPDLVVRRGRLWLRTLGGLDPIDVVYRRLSDAVLDPIEASASSTAGVPGLVLATGEGGVVLANGHGSGVLEDPTLAPFWATAVEGLTGTALTLRDLRPGEVLGTVPGFRDGHVADASAVIRLHAVAGPDGVTVMAGGNGRVLNAADHPRRPTARVAKDVWVLGAHAAAPVIVAPSLPQVDLVSSVPTRAADALFWVGRAAERAEAIAKTARVIASRRQQDPSLATSDGGRWARRMAYVLRVVRGESLDVDPPAGRPILALDHELAEATRAVADRLNALLADGATVGEYLSVTTSRVFSKLAQSRDALSDGRAPIDVLDDTIADLAAFVGLWNESTVHGPAWRFGDMGRRVERSLVVLGLVDSCVRRVEAPRPEPPSDPTDPAERARVAAAVGMTTGPIEAIEPTEIVDQSALEVLLAANESLVAYRRRHRSDVELAPTGELLLQDADNPRSYAASMQRLAEHVDAVEWSHGRRAVATMAAALDGPDPLDRVAKAYDGVEAFAQLVIDTWFATPVNPMIVRGRLR